MSLSADEVRWVAKLARLELNDADLQKMTQQLGAIVEYVAQLQQVNTDGVEPLYHALPVHNVFRNDEPRPSLPVDVALANAPDRRGAFYGVPAVLDLVELRRAAALIPAGHTAEINPAAR